MVSNVCNMPFLSVFFSNATFRLRQNFTPISYLFHHPNFSSFFSADINGPVNVGLLEHFILRSPLFCLCICSFCVCFFSIATLFQCSHTVHAIFNIVTMITQTVQLHHLNNWFSSLPSRRNSQFQFSWVVFLWWSTFAHCRDIRPRNFDDFMHRVSFPPISIPFISIHDYSMGNFDGIFFQHDTWFANSIPDRDFRHRRVFFSCIIKTTRYAFFQYGDSMVPIFVCESLRVRRRVLLGASHLGASNLGAWHFLLILGRVLKIWRFFSLDVEKKCCCVVVGPYSPLFVAPCHYFRRALCDVVCMHSRTW